jgi:serine-type D-Ala-D-Ala carboxypeptidase (penicillin-binding protein 5/6)
MRSTTVRGRGVLQRVKLLLLLLAAISLAHTGGAAAQGDVTTKARQAILMDSETGAVLFQHNADELVPPASMSKLMTLAVIFKALKAGEIKLEDEFLMSVNAWRSGGAPSGTSAMLVPVNTKEPLDQLLQGIIVQSGNDACIAVAEGMAGSEEAFAQRMTQEARDLGLKKSTFRNATGLYDPAHLMTVRELAHLARHLIRDYPEYYSRFAQREFMYRKHRFINRNPLLPMSLGVDGLKTGFVKEAGYGIVVSAKQDNRRLILVLNGLDRQDERKNEAVRLLEWGFKGFGEFKLFDPGEIVAQARVWGGNRMFLPLTGSEEGVSIVLPKSSANQRLRAELIYKAPLKAPIRKGDTVAMLRVTTPTQTVNEVPLHAADDVAPGNVFRRGLDTIVHMAFRWAL